MRDIAFVGDRLYAVVGDEEVFVLHKDRVSLWRDGRLSRMADVDARNPSDMASSLDGVYVTDPDSGQVLYAQRNGAVTPVGGTEASPGCEDDPLAARRRRCLHVRAVAVARDGNVYLALHGLAMIVDVTTPQGRMVIVAGEGPMGWRGGRAVQARLGVVNALPVGPDGDLYVAERYPIARIRRIAEPATAFDEPRPAVLDPHDPGQVDAYGSATCALL